MKQYNAIKVKYPDALLLFRVGDFYETFGSDAVKAAQILDIILTKRGSGSESETALAGFPHHALNTYLPKLVKAGERVAICDQLEDPKKTKTIVKRGVTELVTPGVSLNDEVLHANTNNFLAAVSLGKSIGVSFLDISTGEFFTTEGPSNYVAKLLQNFNPSEVLIEKQKRKQFEEIFGQNLHCFPLDGWIYNSDYAQESLCTHFKTKNLKGYGIDSLTDAVIASGAILHYLAETQHQRLTHITAIQRLFEDRYLWMDKFTIRNLELYHSTNPNAVTLVDVIDRTLTPMGGRLLKRWMALPLKSLDEIRSRHAVVNHLKNDHNLRQKFQQQFKGIGDLERLISKVATARISPKEVVHLKNTLEAIIPLKEHASSASATALKKIGEAMDPCMAMQEKISFTLNEDAPVHILKGGTIASDANAELAELRNMANSGKAYLDQMLERETQSTGITSLKIASNNVFGYYIEVRNTHKDKVPENWIRKQTLVNAERYITEELKEYEAKITGAEERILAIEQEMFTDLVEWLLSYIKTVQNNANLLAQLDCLCGFAQLAVDQHYVLPEMDDSFDLDIKQGRHPVIERQLPPGDDYVANDVFLDREQQQIIMITGPNMSGKSALLRQTALIVLLAQMGSFVPASVARIGIVDKLFTRVGANDNISVGESTFMVEMNESASILNNISDRSLILLDEIGRGTSTYDGISIAKAISEYVHEHPSRPKTLFATHYHELNAMSERFSRIKNFNVSVKELKDTVLFLRKLTPGGSQHSFGIHVAKMAGMPPQVIKRATALLKSLEKSGSSNQIKKGISSEDSDLQLSIFKLDDPILETLRDDILALDIDTLTPVEALMKLNEIKRILTQK